MRKAAAGTDEEHVRLRHACEGDRTLGVLKFDFTTRDHLLHQFRVDVPCDRLKVDLQSWQQVRRGCNGERNTSPARVPDMNVLSGGEQKRLAG